MKTWLLCGVWWCGAWGAAAAAPDRPFFAALGMTKEQRNVAAPSISGVFRQTGADHWEHFGGDQIEWVNTAAQNPSQPGTLLLGCGNGILRSRDGGATWRLTTGWQVADVLALQIDPASPTTAYAATAWGVWKTGDGGDHWRETDDGRRADGKYSYNLVIDRSRPNRIVVGTDFGLVDSQDGGARWRELSGSPPGPILHLEQSAKDAQLWLAGTLGHGVLVSRDGGSSWIGTAAPLARAHVYGGALDPTDSLRMAAAGWNEGVWISGDGGKTWSDRTQGLPVKQVTAMIFDPRNPGRLWVSTFQEGTFFSDDLGRRWTFGGLYGASVIELKFLPQALHD